MAKAKQVGSWGDIPQETFEAFYKAVVKLRDEMIPRDGDGDSPIELTVINRMIHEPFSYFPVPRAEVYSYVTHNYLRVHPEKLQEMQDETERWLTANVDIAASALEQYMKLKYHRNMTEREARMPFPEQIKRACQHCAKGVKFKPEPHPTDFRVKYPEYPLMYHVGDFGSQTCRDRPPQESPCNKSLLGF